MTQASWPVDSAGQPVPRTTEGWPDFPAVQWPQVGGQWAPVGPDGRPVLGAPPPPPRKKGGKGKWVALAAVVIVIIAIAAGNAGNKKGKTLTGQSGTPVASGSQGAQPHSQTARVGESIHVTGNDGLDATVTVVSVHAYKEGRGDIAEPPANGNYVVADILVAAAGGSYDFNPLYFNWQEPDGTTRDALSGNAATAGFDPAFKSGRISAGQKTRGFVTWDTSATTGKIQLTDPLGGVVGEWTVGA